MQPHEDAPYGPAPKTPTEPNGLRSVTLASAIDLDGFRRACRRLWAEQVEPVRVSWHAADDSEADLFDDEGANSRAPAAPPVRVPPSFMPVCESVILHSDPGRFGLLYRLLWRLQVEPGLRHDALDADWVAAQTMSQAVRRDMHKMKASVRFRTIEDATGGAPLHLAWFAPEHHVVETTAPFFARRFAMLHWAILTPDRSVRWDGERLVLGAAARRDQAPADDAGERLWLRYYERIFNPQHPMPAASAAERNTNMVQRQPADPEKRGPGTGPKPTPDHDVAPATLPALREALERCRECPIGEHATQAVPGEGPKHARLMFVGEQPGDQEDLQGRPFVGPAGQLFNRALEQLGIERREVYISNAVKHFKFELRGKRRIHKTPAQQEAAACLHWLESEIELVDPGALVALGATAARQLMGTAIAVTRQRGQWLERADGRRVLITLHPSALLRMEPEDKEAAYAAWLADLRKATAR
jgi:probable DNA metabolism protein